MRSNLLTKWTGMRRGGVPYEYSETTFSYLKMQLAGGAWVATGAYQGGAVTGTVSGVTGGLLGGTGTNANGGGLLGGATNLLGKH